MRIQQRIGAGLVAMSWCAGACGVSGQQPAASSAPAAQGARAPARAVVCLVTVSESVRMYRLHEADRLRGTGREWRLTMTEPASKRPPLVLPLPGAAPDITAKNARLSYRSGDGGLVVNLDSSGGAAWLEVKVDVAVAGGIDATLAPEIGRLNTPGAVRLPPCRVETS